MITFGRVVRMGNQCRKEGSDNGFWPLTTVVYLMIPSLLQGVRSPQRYPSPIVPVQTRGGTHEQVKLGCSPLDGSSLCLEPESDQTGPESRRCGAIHDRGAPSQGDRPSDTRTVRFLVLARGCCAAQSNCDFRGTSVADIGPGPIRPTGGPSFHQPELLHQEVRGSSSPATIREKSKRQSQAMAIQGFVCSVVSGRPQQVWVDLRFEDN